MMLLRNELENLHDILFTKCSLKEKLFYHFFIKQPFAESLEVPTGDLDKICFKVFTNLDVDVTKEVQRIAPSEPFKHIHFSSSIITLIPVCLLSNDAKKKYLKSYFDSHSMAEKLLLFRIFPTEKFQFVNDPITSMDKLIDETFFHPHVENALTLLPLAFLELNDIVGLLAFREVYLELLKIHPNTALENQFSELQNDVRKLIAVVTRRIDLLIDILFFLLFLLGSPLVVYEINSHYIQYEVDKLSDIWTFVSPLMIPLFYFGKKLFPNIFSFYADFKHLLVVIWFWTLRLNFSKLNKLCK